VANQSADGQIGKVKLPQFHGQGRLGALSIQGETPTNIMIMLDHLLNFFKRKPIQQPKQRYWRCGTIDLLMSERRAKINPDALNGAFS